ncbi:MAG: hypothetical protein RIR62_27 [Pseudomonadota bacterium]|jgi:hypothetical protein
MEPDFNIPHRRRQMPFWRICLIMGLTALLLLLLSSRIDSVVAMLGMLHAA